MTGPWDERNDGGRRDQRRPSSFLGRALLHVWQGVTFWRVFAVIAFLAIMGATQRDEITPMGPHVARVWIDGLIMDDPARTELLEDLADDPKVEAILLRIDSPGGTIAGSEALYETLREVAGTKPVVAALGEVAASGGYIAALGADRIVSRGATATASIGVLMQYPRIDGLLAKIGVEMNDIKSSPIKAEPDPFGEPPEMALELHRDLVMDGYRWFRGLVKERRGLAEAELDRVADGRVMSGRQALEAGLVDEIGGEREAMAWLIAEHEIEAPLRDRRVDEDAPEGIARFLLGALGLPGPEALLPREAARALIGPRAMAILD